MIEGALLVVGVSPPLPVLGNAATGATAAGACRRNGGRFCHADDLNRRCRRQRLFLFNHRQRLDRRFYRRLLGRSDRDFQDWLLSRSRGRFLSGSLGGSRGRSVGGVGGRRRRGRLVPLSLNVRHGAASGQERQDQEKRTSRTTNPAAATGLANRPVANCLSGCCCISHLYLLLVLLRAQTEPASTEIRPFDGSSEMGGRQSRGVMIAATYRGGCAGLSQARRGWGGALFPVPGCWFLRGGCCRASCSACAPPCSAASRGRG